MQKILCSNVSKTYKVGLFRRQNITALNDVTFEVGNNEVFGIIGPNGAGKSTAIKTLMGFIFQDSGSITINGISSTKAMSRSNVGYLPEAACLYPNLTIFEHLEFACIHMGIRGREKSVRIKTVLNAVNLSPKKSSTKINHFSKGMTQRAALAYALITEPSILVLDEPMSGLDPLGRQLVIDLIGEYKSKGITILFCSHILTDVERICDRIAVLDQGQLLALTTPQQLKKYSQENHLQENMTSLESFFLETLKANNH